MGFDATGGKPYKAAQDGPIWYAVIGAVAVVAFGAVFMGPKLLGGGSNGTIEKLVAGRNVPEAAGLINAYGFKDETTKTFLARLQKFDPEAHAELLTDMARAALKGADREQLAAQMLDWTQAYVTSNADLLRHSDPRYVDKLLPLVRAAFDAMQKTDASLCEVDKMMRIGADPKLMHSYMRYGGPLYNVSMQGNSIVIGMIENGRKRLASGDSAAYFAEAEGVSETDKKAVAAAMMSMMADPDIQKIMVGAQSGEGGVPKDVNVCRIGARLVEKFEALDPGVRERLWASVLSGEVGAIS